MKRNGIAQIIDQKKTHALPKSRQCIAEIEPSCRRINAGEDLKATERLVSGQAHPFVWRNGLLSRFDQPAEPQVERLRISYGDAARTKADEFLAHLNRRQERRSLEVG